MDSKSRRFSVSNWILFIATSIIPICLCVLGVRKIILNKVFSSLTMIFFFLLPILFVIAIFFVVRKEIKFTKKILLWFILSIIYVLISFVSLLFTDDIKKASYFDEHALNYCNETLLYYPVFSAVTDLGNYKSIECHDISYLTIISETNTNVLICQYDADEYENLKNYLEKFLILETDMILLGDYEKRRESFPEVYIDDYYFRLLECDYEVYSNGVYPNSLAFFVTNDITCEIAIVTSYDTELDYIEDLEEYILNGCCWRFVR